MARSRRPRGGGGPDVLRGTLGTLVRSTLAQAGVVRDVLERGAREGRARLDSVRRERARTDALAALGEAVLAELEAGQFPELLEVPAVADAVAALDEPEPEPAAWTPTRRGPRFDQESARAERGPVRGGAPRARAGDDDDGTVSAAAWRPPAPRRPAPVWRPPADDLAEVVAAAPAPRAGGIQFTPAGDDDEEDLAAYMHPDDVPPRDPAT
ncbi:MAG: hypothetical protein R3B06_09555 [Kofleriaceae bacterium]